VMMADRPTPTPQNPTGHFRTSGAEDMVLKAFATSPAWPTASAGIFARTYCWVADQPQVKALGFSAWLTWPGGKKISPHVRRSLPTWASANHRREKLGEDRHA
jgi:hypothetical protein